MISIGDLLYAFAQWLKTTPLVEFSLWLSKTPLSEAADKAFWTTPIAQTIHILAIAATFGAVGMIVLRIFALAGTKRTMAETAERYMPWIWWGLVTLVVTGIVMIFTDPIRCLMNPAFWSKMILVIALALTSWAFAAAVRRKAAWLELTDGRRKAVQAAAVGVVVLWCAIIAFGRWIAYVPV
jgi:hypothetical protein